MHLSIRHNLQVFAAVAAKMVIRYNDIVHVITTLADEENIAVTVKATLKGSLICGGACAIGGLVLGPPGMAIGGAVGGGVAYCLARDSFKPLSHIILHEMRYSICNIIT